MMQALRVVWHFSLVELKRYLTYIGNSLLLSIHFAFMIFITVWVFRSINTDALFHNAFGRTQILVYVTGFWIIREFISIWTDFEIAELVRNGNILFLLNKPYSLQLQFLARQVGQKLNKLLQSVAFAGRPLGALLPLQYF